MKRQLSFIELQELIINTNKLSMQLNNLAYKLNSSLERKARTRTLIQLGSLVDKAGILIELFNIATGEALEQDIAFMNKAASLFGFPVDTIDNTHIDDKNRNKWYR